MRNFQLDATQWPADNRVAHTYYLYSFLRATRRSVMLRKFDFEQNKAHRTSICSFAGEDQPEQRTGLIRVRVTILRCQCIPAVMKFLEVKSK